MYDPMNDDDLQKSLDAFAENPAQEMGRLPEKRDPEGSLIKQPFTPFSASDLGDGHFALHRDTVRKTFSTVVDGVFISLEDCIPGKAPIESGDRAENLVDALRYASLDSMEKAGLRKATLSTQPWSDDYWAIYLGCLGKRYADPDLPRSSDWMENREYVRQNPAQKILSSGDACAIDLLSPSEKYDALLGDSAGSLTAAMWAQGESYYNQSGEVESWMGICHGWAPASYMLPRPRKPVTVWAADGKTQLTFYPADIKALASLLWASASTVTKFIGGRCNDKNPATDANGRVISARAFDTNPGTWHLAIVNQLGAAGRSLVMDATYDYEVWNQPVAGYDYRYFNPQTMKLVKTLDDAKVAKRNYSRDPFKKYRGRSAAAYAGVIMQVRYMVETAPEQRDSDGPNYDAVNTVIYKYDLELNADGRIIGGEWFTGKCHPDFLWTPPQNARATSPADQQATGSWEANQVLPQSWRRAGISAASRGMPLAKVVETLIRLASD